MKKYLILLLFVALLSSSAFAQSFLGYTTAQVNFRDSPSTNGDVIKSLQRGSGLFIVSLTKENGFYNVIDIDTDKEGYIHSSFVKVQKALPKSDQGIFSPTGETASYDPEIKINNNTSKTLSLKMGSEVFSFKPHEERTVTVSPGTYDFRASAPGVIPNYGSESIKGNMRYEWEFFIRVSYR